MKLDEICSTAIEKLEDIRNRQERIEEMDQDRAALLESYAHLTPKALEELTPEERRHGYRMLRLQASLKIGRTLEVSGMFGEGSSLCYSDTRS